MNAEDAAALRLADDELWSLARLGFILYSRDRLDEARAIFEGIVALRADHGYAWFALGLVARQRREGKLARDYFAHAVSIDPDLDDCRIALAEVLLEEGDHAGACRTLQPFAESGSQEAAAVRGRALLRSWKR